MALSEPRGYAGPMGNDVWTVDDHLRGKPEGFVALYLRIEDLVTGLGDVTLSVSRSTITFKGLRRGTWTTSPSAGCARHIR